MPFLSNLVITPWDKINWQLCDDLVYQTHNGDLITVKKGFITDGESGPPAIKDIFLESNVWRQQAAFLHDALYRSQINRDWADSIYLEALQSLPIAKDDAEELYQAVHLFGESSFRGDQKNLDLAHIRIQVK